MLYAEMVQVRQVPYMRTFNLAMLWQLPVYFCLWKLNGYAMGTSVGQERSILYWYLEIGVRLRDACGLWMYGSRRKRVAKEMNKAIERARSGGGPTFLEMKTYRY